jgi:hypothetical protein
MLGRLLLILFFAAGTLTRPCLGQNDNAAGGNSASPGTPNPPNAATSTPKKIWTNDDVPSAKTGVSASEKRNTNARAMPSQTVDTASVQRIRNRLEKLQAQLDDVNKKLTIYKEFQAGEPVSTADREINKGINRVPVDQQIVQLQQKKKQIEGQISDLYDEARKKGIDPGLLR